MRTKAKTLTANVVCDGLKADVTRLGVILGGVVTLLGMGATSWWLIGLQRYKNEIHGPWDPARPVIRRHWD